MHTCRDCSAAFHLAPYQGKYPAPHRAPDPLEMQKLLAGMADRGADVAVVECEADGLADGRSWPPFFLCPPAASSQRPLCSFSRIVSRGMARLLAAFKHGGRLPTECGLQFCRLDMADIEGVVEITGDI